MELPSVESYKNRCRMALAEKNIIGTESQWFKMMKEQGHFVKGEFKPAMQLLKDVYESQDLTHEQKVINLEAVESDFSVLARILFSG